MAMNKVLKINNLDSQFDKLEELWLNDNKISDFAGIEYLGGMKKLDNLYIATNPVYKRNNDFT